MKRYSIGYTLGVTAACLLMAVVIIGLFTWVAARRQDPFIAFFGVVLASLVFIGVGRLHRYDHKDTGCREDDDHN